MDFRRTCRFLTFVGLDPGLLILLFLVWLLLMVLWFFGLACLIDWLGS